MELNREKVAKAFLLNWKHGDDDKISWDNLLYSPCNNEEKELCNYLKEIGYAWKWSVLNTKSVDVNYVLSSKGAEAYKQSH